MSFHYTAEEGSIRVEDNHILRARLQRADGEWQDAEIDLNQYIGNENGMSLMSSSTLFPFLPSFSRTTPSSFETSPFTVVKRHGKY